VKRRLFVLLATFYLLVASREPPWGDAHVVYETTQSLVERFRLDVNLGGPPQFYALRGGKKYGVFPLGNVVAMAPGYLVYRALRALPHPPAVDELLYRLTSHLSPALLGAAACVLLFAMARREGASERAAFWLALLLGTCTILLIYARAPFSEALQTLAFTWVADRCLALDEQLDGRRALGLGAALGLLVNTKLVYGLILPVPAIYFLIRYRRQAARLAACFALAALPFTALLAAALAHNVLKTGALLDSGYRIPEGVFSGDAYAGLWGFFFSTGKSIFLYSPPLLLAPAAWVAYARARRARAVLLGALAGVVILTDAKFRYWHADYCWGPRLLVPLVPTLMLPLAPWIEGALRRGRRAARALGVGALVGAGLWVQLLGGAFYWDHYIRIAIAVKDQTGAPGWYGEDLHHCHFIPQFSPLVGHAWMLRHVAREDTAATIGEDAPWRRVAPGRVNLASEWPGVRLDWWVLDWAPARSARRWMVGTLALLVGLGGWAAAGARRRLRASPTERSPSAGAIGPA
jgi:hypothetical protein